MSDYIYPTSGDQCTHYWHSVADVLDPLELDSFQQGSPELPMRWSLWRDSWNIDDGRAELSDLHKLQDVILVQSFRECLPLHTAQTVRLHSLHVFKAGIMPLYDDPHNRCGGHFKIKARTVDDAHKIWALLTVSLVLEKIPRIAQICGVTIAKKPRNMLLKLWITSSRDKKLEKELTVFLTRTLGTRYVLSMKLCPHAYILKTNSQKNIGSNRNIPSPTMYTPAFTAKPAIDSGENASQPYPQDGRTYTTTSYQQNCAAAVTHSRPDTSVPYMEYQTGVAYHNSVGPLMNPHINSLPPQLEAPQNTLRVPVVVQWPVVVPPYPYGCSMKLYPHFHPTPSPPVTPSAHPIPDTPPTPSTPLTPSERVEYTSLVPDFTHSPYSYPVTQSTPTADTSANSPTYSSRNGWRQNIPPTPPHTMEFKEMGRAAYTEPKPASRIADIWG